MGYCIVNGFISISELYVYCVHRFKTSILSVVLCPFLSCIFTTILTFILLNRFNQFIFIFVKDLDAIQKRVNEMEQEAQKLKKLQEEEEMDATSIESLYALL